MAHKWNVTVYNQFVICICSNGFYRVYIYIYMSKQNLNEQNKHRNMFAYLLKFTFPSHLRILHLTCIIFYVYTLDLKVRVWIYLYVCISANTLKSVQNNIVVSTIVDYQVFMSTIVSNEKKLELNMT